MSNMIIVCGGNGAGKGVFSVSRKRNVSDFVADRFHLYRGNGVSLFSVSLGEYGMPKTVWEKFSPHAGIRAPIAILEKHLCRGGGVAAVKRRHRSSLFSWVDSAGRFDSHQPCIRRLRYDLHSVFLSLPNLVDEKPLLHRLSDL